MYNSLLGNTAQFDNEMDLAAFEGLEGLGVDKIRPQKIVFNSPWSSVSSCWPQAARINSTLPKRLDEKSVVGSTWFLSKHPVSVLPSSTFPTLTMFD